ncbi:hypothetical protein M422DRAFT_783257 [Sphaerobolus stellatus SS14]|uniref:Uncharacterized protein n=1 Tax=Sphaerobolus stellatus (strain SS14) TaxID=990650 RepID=A0A0C9V6A7_SPHS4|nr:hypothetical protein M422DRAFT_783257 [Sphaerobolus stellatus SS14]
MYIEITGQDQLLPGWATIVTEWLRWKDDRLTTKLSIRTITWPPSICSQLWPSFLSILYTLCSMSRDRFGYPKVSRLVKVVDKDPAFKDGDHLYQPLSAEHYAIPRATETMNAIADQIEKVITADEPYEINLFGTTAIQKDCPLPGASVGLVADPRHSFSLGVYVRLSSNPKSTYALTVPLNMGSGDGIRLYKGAVVSQPSVSDRTISQTKEDQDSQELLRRDAQQAAAVARRRRKLLKTFEFARAVASSRDPVEANITAITSKEGITFETVWDGSTPKPNGILSTIALRGLSIGRS